MIGLIEAERREATTCSGGEGGLDRIAPCPGIYAMCCPAYICIQHTGENMIYFNVSSIT